MNMKTRTQHTTGKGCCRLRPRLLVLALLLALGPALAAEENLVAYKAARIVSKAGESVSPGFLLVRKGKVEKVLGADAKLPDGARVVDLKEAVILPGLVNPLSAISQAITIGIGQLKICSQALFVAIAEAIPIRIGIHAIKRTIQIAVL